MDKVSIIVPIYNEEENLKKCIDSLINQTYNNLEIILINDGSTDKSKKIIDSYQDKRIIAIHKKNTGIGDTRNTGIDKSTGDYIMFVDSDDYIELNCVETLVKKAKEDNVDLVIANYYLDTPSKTYEIKFEDLGITNIKKDPDLLCKINFAPWNKLYKKELFKDTNSRFPIGIKYEDAPVVVDAVINAQSISFVSDYLFHYVMKKSGETITRDERIFDIITICAMIEKKLVGHEYINKTNLFVKILMSYLKNSRHITNINLRNEFIDAVYLFLRRVDKKWYKCSYLKNENKLKKVIITHKNLLKEVNKIKS